MSKLIDGEPEPWVESEGGNRSCYGLNKVK